MALFKCIRAHWRDDGWMFIALALSVGHFTPWASHHTAALTLNAHELAVFTNLTPGAGVFLNEWFLLPLLVAAGLWSLSLTPRRRALGVAVGLGVASLGLPGYPQVLTILHSSEERLRLGLALAGFSCVAISSALSTRFGEPARAWFGGMLCLMVVLPLVGYLAIRPCIETLYGSRVGIGWGWWVTALSAITGVVTSLSSALQHPNAYAGARRAASPLNAEQSDYTSV